MKCEIYFYPASGLYTAVTVNVAKTRRNSNVVTFTMKRSCELHMYFVGSNGNKKFGRHATNRRFVRKRPQIYDKVVKIPCSDSPRLGKSKRASVGGNSPGYKKRSKKSFYGLVFSMPQCRHPVNVIAKLEFLEIREHTQCRCSRVYGHSHDDYRLRLNNRDILSCRVH